MKPLLFNLCREFRPQRSPTGFKVETQVPRPGSFPRLVQNNRYPASSGSLHKAVGVNPCAWLWWVSLHPSGAVCIAHSACFPEELLSEYDVSEVLLYASDSVLIPVSISWNHGKDRDLKPPWNCHDGNPTKPSAGLCAPWFPCEDLSDSEAASGSRLVFSPSRPPHISWVPVAQSIWVHSTWITILLLKKSHIS